MRHQQIADRIPSFFLTYIVYFFAGSGPFQFSESTTTNQQSIASLIFQFGKTDINTGSSTPAPPKTGEFSFGGDTSTGSDGFRFGKGSSKSVLTKPSNSGTTSNPPQQLNELEATNDDLHIPR